MTPNVSIITPLYNAQATIQETMDSVAAQTRQDWEHIIINNASTDEGMDIVRAQAAKDSRIVILEQNEVPSAGLTRNAGIKAARGRYIAFLDADDTWDATKLETHIAFMEENDLAFSWTSYRVNTGKQTMPVRKASQKASARDLLAKRAVIGCLTTIYDTQHLGKIYMTDIAKRQDFVLFVTLLREVENKGLKAGGLQTTLATYRLQTNSLSSSKSSAAKYQWKALVNYCGINKLEAVYLFLSYAWHGIKDRIGLKKK